jgi:hypothetical protein
MVQDRLRGQYHALSADPNSLANLDQDLPNSMQDQIPIWTLDQDWLWCQTWCNDESLATAKTSECGKGGLRLRRGSCNCENCNREDRVKLTWL